MKGYARFAAMIATSTIVMYFLMFLNVFKFNHFTLSETRIYMALLMGSCMSIIMMLFMWKMHKKRAVNFAILGTSAVVFALSLWLVRSQTTVEDTSFMKSMIPHHSIAILTSERANFSDPRVQKLADEIVKTQEKEIAEMKKLIKDIEEEKEKEDEKEDEKEE
ncbi:DUF305 domain-containing protein [Bacillus marinisedimentorum]|uniref:DUF305 domain-containing protein n=1 Tax=Bacillus marinisedimentorum TaxID=1821260 RepID=UPI000872F90B|nr:DUF305 domain-containing protein [Bacillus marinisedimentorum]